MSSPLAVFLRKPMVYVRRHQKGHGTRRLVEGDVPKGSRVLLVDDLVFFLGREALEKTMGGDLMACKDFLQSQNFVRRDRLGITGFCVGGGLAYQLSTM
jgi:hypothetical protein